MRWTLLGLACALLGSTGVSVAHAQDGGDAGGDGGVLDSGAADSGGEAPLLTQAEITPLAARDIGPRIEETFTELQDLTPWLRRQRAVLNIEEALPEYRVEVDALRTQPVLEHLDSLSPRRLTDLEHEWHRVHARLIAWQTDLNTRIAQLTDERDAVIRKKRLWRTTLTAEREDPLPEAQAQRVRELLDHIQSIQHRLSMRLEEVLELSAALSDEGFRISAVVSRISWARQRARDERLHRDHEPLWTGGQALPGARPEPRFLTVWQEHITGFVTFVRHDGGRLVYHLAVILLLGVVFLLLRRRFGAAKPRSHAPSPVRALRGRPFASAGLLGLLLTPFFYPYVPAIIEGLTLVLLVPTIIRLVPYLMPTSSRGVSALMGVTAVSALLSLDYAPAPVRRALVLLLTVGAVGILAWMSRRPERERVARSDITRRRLHWFMRVAILPMLAAAYFDVTGYVERAVLWTVATLSVLEVMLGAVFGFELVAGMLKLSARHRFSRVLRTLRHHRRPTVRGTITLLRVFVLGGLGYFALEAFDVRDPLQTRLRLMLRESYEFGSIELSVGDVLAFTAVIAGTFVVVRAVHLILQRELLPRLELGQGTESAISLTVSYLLVALGVVLAFGTAGVDPEQLALLGGALGVGIGFGLQNVVSNFVAGLILVAERPIKVGDVIEIGDLVGQVNRIGIRSSTVRSLEGAEVIVPNSTLISGQLVNWTHSDARRRVDLPVGVSYRHNPEQVKPILERVVRRQPGVLHEPPPAVIVTGFGESSVDFEVRAWIADFAEAPRVKSELAQRIFTALESEKIEIPFPQLDLHLKSEVRLEGERRVDTPAGD